MTTEPLSGTDLLEKVENFYLEYYKEEAFKAILNYYTLKIPHNKLLEYDPEFEDILNLQPQDLILILRTALKHLEPETKIKIELTELPPSKTYKITELNPKLLKQYIAVTGNITILGRKHMRTVSTQYNCVECGKPQIIPATILKRGKPSFCREAGCVSKKFNPPIDHDEEALRIIFEPPVNEFTNENLDKKLVVIITGSYADHIHLEKYSIGNQFKINGFLHGLNESKDQENPVKYYYFEALSIEPIQQEDDLTITEQDEKDILKFSQDPAALKLIADNINPAVLYFDKINQATVLQLVGCPEGIMRHTSHQLIVSEASHAKSFWAKEILNIAQKAKYILEPNTTAVGITASVLIDPATKERNLMPGALPRTDGGLLIVDEAFKKKDPDSDESYRHLLSALSDMFITIDKAGFVGYKLWTRTNALFITNPRGETYDKGKRLMEQVNISKPMYARLDLIWVLAKIEEKQKIEGVLDLMAQNVDKEKSDDIDELRTIPKLFIKKYIHYAQRFKPKLKGSPEELDVRAKLKEAYYFMFNFCKDPAGVLPNPIQFRDMECLLRLSKANARFHLRNHVLLCDVKKAFEIKMASIQSLAREDENGVTKFDNVNPTLTLTKDEIRDTIIQIIQKKKDEGGTIDYATLRDESIKSRVPEDKFERAIHTLKNENYILESPPGRFYPI